MTPRAGEGTPDLRGQGETILVVEDEHEIAFVLEQALTDQGYRVIVCYSGSHAVIEAQATLPDLVLLDVLLPGLDGWAVCAALQQEPETATIPVIFVTALDDIGSMVRGLLGYQNTVDYLSKPFGLDELLARVKVALRHERLLTQAALPAHQGTDQDVDVEQDDHTDDHSASTGEQ